MGKLRFLLLVLCAVFSGDLLSQNKTPITYFKCAPGDVNECQLIYRDGYAIETIIHNCMSKSSCAINTDVCLDYKANNVYYKVFEHGHEKLYQYNFLTFSRRIIPVLTDIYCQLWWKIHFE